MDRTSRIIILLIFAAFVTAAAIIVGVSMAAPDDGGAPAPATPANVAVLCESVPNGVAINPREDWTPESRPAGC